jgi:hypothetical protein
MLTYSNAELQRVVDDIRLAVNSLTPLSVASLADCAAVYAEATDAANERLRRCGHLLAKGLRAEAIQFCEQEPNLLEVVSLLDFPELPQWNALLAAQGLVLAPPLLFDVAEQLNRAYAEDQQLSHLFRQHRLLAMGRAPLASRITVLRRIRAADPDNAIWQDDLQLLEQARLQELMTDIRQCERTRNLEKLLALREEIRGGGWLQPPSAAIVRAAEQLVAKLSQQSAREQLERMLAPLDEAYSAFDVDAARALRSQWDVAAGVAQLSPHDPLAQHAAPAWEWLARQEESRNNQDQYERAVSELEAALDTDTPRLELERLYHAAMRYGEGLPVTLEQRLRTRLEEFDLRGRRRSRLLLAGVLGVVLLIGSATGYFILRQAHLREVREITATLAQLIDNEQYREAERVLAEAAARDARLSAAATVQAEVARMNQLQADEAERLHNFKNALARAREAGVDQPDRTALEQARTWARDETEKAEVAMFEAAIATASRKSQATRDNEFSEQLQSLKTRVTALEAMDVAAAEAETKLLTQDIKAAHAALGVSSLLMRQLDPLQARVEAKQDQLQQRSAELAELATIVKHVGDAQRFANALLAYGNKFPLTQRGKEFQQTALESELWLGIAPWTTWASREPLKSGAVLSPTLARQILDEGRKLNEEHGAYPLAKLFLDHQPYLEAYAARVEDDGRSLDDRAKALFRDPLMTDLYRLKTSRGKCYYLRALPSRYDEALPEQSVGFDYVESFALSTSKARVPRKEIAELELAPQVDLALLATKQLDALNDANWDRTFAGLASLVQSHPDIDPILRIAILKRVLEFGSTGSYRFQTVFAPKQAALLNAKVDVSALWMLPDDPSAITNRALAERALTAIQEAAYAENPTPPTAQAFFAWDGFLWRDEQGAWQWMRSGLLPTQGVVAILIQAEDAGRLEFQEIGKCAAGAVHWTSADGAHFREGRPLFWKGVAPASPSLPGTPVSRGDE